MLQTVDNLWKDHLLSMDHLKEGIGLRGYAQQNPLIVYKKEGFDMFQEMIIQDQRGDPGHHVQDSARRTGGNLEDLHEPKEQNNLVFSGTGMELQEKDRSNGKGRKWAETPPAPAAAGKNTKNAAGDR